MGESRQQLRAHAWSLSNQNILAVLLLPLAIACGKQAESPGDSSSGAAGDYGDAPDGRPTTYTDGASQGSFPTAADNDGARTVSTDVIWLGPSVSAEAGVSDPNDPDGRPNHKTDADDGVVGLQLDMTDNRARATLTVRVSGKKRGTKAWINVLVDLDKDGKWSPSGEWVVQNHAVELASSLTRPVQLPPFDYEGPNGVPNAAWMRVSLTTESVPDAWDGRGSFPAGEIEDHLVELGSGSAPMVGVDCINPSSATGKWAFDGARHVAVQCSITPLGKPAKGSEVSFTMRRQKGGVRHTGLCGAVATEVDGSGKSVQGGPISLDSSSTSFECVFERNAPLPSEWLFEVPLGKARMEHTSNGVRMGVKGGISSSFLIERGSCAQKCGGDHECGAESRCSNGCCVQAWARSCEELDAADCGRCCALTAGGRAGDCVRQACGL
jgi:hypothetical protein